MVDSVITTIGWTFLIDFSVFLLTLLIFFFYRLIRGDRDDNILPNWSHA
jgi:hypothetical protein